MPKKIFLAAMIAISMPTFFFWNRQLIRTFDWARACDVEMLATGETTCSTPPPSFP